LLSGNIGRDPRPEYSGTAAKNARIQIAELFKKDLREIPLKKYRSSDTYQAKPLVILAGDFTTHKSKARDEI
jgi:hypothetical protein